jgi:hypothetical protein
MRLRRAPSWRSRSERLEEVVERLGHEGSAQDLEHGALVVDVAIIDIAGQYLHVESTPRRCDSEGHSIDLDGLPI